MTGSDGAGESRTILVDGGSEGDRLDRFLAAALTGDLEVSRSRLKRLIKSGGVVCGGEAKNDGTITLRDPAVRVKAGDCLTVSVPAASTELTAESMALVIVHEDDDVLVINKPAGLVVHPAPGNWSGTLVNGLLEHCGPSLAAAGGGMRPGIVHRLDKGTSGLLVVARTAAAYAGLRQQFAPGPEGGKDARLVRDYTALVWGEPVPASAVLESPIGRHPRQRLKMTVRREGGKPARTRYRIDRRYGDPVRVSRLACMLETGRTHQIRVHCSHAGHPLLGDGLYGAGFRTRVAGLPESGRRLVDGLKHPLLHAGTLGFEHPRTGEGLVFHAPLPALFEQVEQALSASSPAPQTT